MFNVKKVALFVGIGFGVFMVAGLSVYGFFMMDNRVLQKMMERSTQINSSTMDANIKIVSGGGQVDGELTMKIKGRYAMKNVNDLANARYIYDYNMGVMADYSDGTFTADADIIQTEKQMFFKLNNIPSLPLEGLEAYQNQWYSLDFAKMLGVSGVQSPMDMQKLTGMTMEINHLLAESKILKVTDDLGKTKIGENSVYHYKVSLNEEALKDLLLQINEKLDPNTGKKVVEGKSDDKSMDYGKSILDQILSFLNITNIEVFIDTTTFDLRRMVFEAEMVLPGYMGNENKMAIAVDVTMDNFNTIKIDEISLPTDTVDIFEKYMEEQNKMMMTKYIDENGQEITEFKLVDDEELTQ
jgi:hypothetical protein